jgi:hypothetical protein
MTYDEMVDVYNAAVKYLDEIKPAGVTLDKYFVGDRKDYATMSDVFEQFIQSAQNYQMMPNVIDFKSRREKVKELLHGFDVTYTARLTPDELCKRFAERFHVENANNKRSCWHKWSSAIVESARFLLEFHDVPDFEGFVRCFDYNVHTRMALPLLISEKIHGIGFALACDLLKELGFTSYPKPDVHLIEVFNSLGFAEDNPISTFEAVVRMADVCKVTPYKVDKIFWLICSGKFYLEMPEINIGGHKREFLEMMEKFRHSDTERR